MGRSILSLSLKGYVMQHSCNIKQRVLKSTIIHPHSKVEQLTVYVFNIVVYWGLPSSILSSAAIFQLSDTLWNIYSKTKHMYNFPSRLYHEPKSSNQDSHLLLSCIFKSRLRYTWAPRLEYKRMASWQNTIVSKTGNGEEKEEISR